MPHSSRVLCAKGGAVANPMKAANRVEIVKGDLTELAVDAIVNAANSDLLLGGGVAGAIRAKGGPAIQQECNAIGSIPIGGAAITGAGSLQAKFVIHAASMQLGGSTTVQALRSSTAHALRIASERALKTIAFPAVGTGIAGFPLRGCAEIMLREVVEHFKQPTSLEKVSFVLFDDAALAAFRVVWDGMKGKSGT